MSKHNNITQDNYKVGGSGHSGENILHELNKQQFAQAQKAKEDEASMIPNQNEREGETPAPGGSEERAGTATPSSNSSKNDY